MLATIQSKTFCIFMCCVKTKIRRYKIVILPMVLYGYETLSLMFREEHKVMVFDNMMLRRIFGLKRMK
jgi:hypothetical protein